MKFVFENDGWWKIVGNKVVNVYGSKHSLNPELPIIEVDDWDSLDWSFLLNRNSPYGWIAPDGTWFGCNYKRHIDVARWFLKSSEDKLEKAGWVKVYQAIPRTSIIDWYSDKYLITHAQAKTLHQKGFDISDYDIKENWNE